MSAMVESFVRRDLFRLGVDPSATVPFVDLTNRHLLAIQPDSSGVKLSDQLAPDGSHAVFFQGGWLEIKNSDAGGASDLAFGASQHIVLSFWFKSIGGAQKRMHAFGFGTPDSNLEVDFGDTDFPSTTTPETACWTYFNGSGDPAIFESERDRKRGFYLDDKWHLYIFERFGTSLTVRVDGRLLGKLEHAKAIGSSEARNFIGRESALTAAWAGVTDMSLSSAYPWQGHIAGFQVAELGPQGMCSETESAEPTFYSFVSQTDRWPQGNLTVSLDPTGCAGITATQARSAITGAFDAWAAACKFFSFKYLIGVPTDLTVRFGGTALDDRFTGPSGVLGSAAPPTGGGRISFDSHETWSMAAVPPAGPAGAPSLVSLPNAALHEIGHALGLPHSNDAGSIMWPWTAGTVNVDPASREQLNLMYGWQEVRRLEDRATTDLPALAASGTIAFLGDPGKRTLHMVWKGTIEDERLFESRLVDGAWTDQAEMPGFASASAPALIGWRLPNEHWRYGLLMAWRGRGEDQQLYYSLYSDGYWAQQAPIGQYSSHRVSLASDGEIRMAWKGANADTRIFWSTYRDRKWDTATSSYLERHWDPPRVIQDNANPPSWQAATEGAPELIVFRGKLYVFWSSASDSTLWFSSCDSEKLDAEGEVEWAVAKQVGMLRAVGSKDLASITASTVTATIRGDNMLLALRPPSHDSLYFVLFDGVEFSGRARLHDFKSSVGADVYTLDGVTHMVCRGIGDERNIFWSDLPFPIV